MSNISKEKETLRIKGNAINHLLYNLIFYKKHFISINAISAINHKSKTL